MTLLNASPGLVKLHTGLVKMHSCMSPLDSLVSWKNKLLQLSILGIFFENISSKVITITITIINLGSNTCNYVSIIKTRRLVTLLGGGWGGGGIVQSILVFSSIKMHQGMWTTRRRGMIPYFPGVYFFLVLCCTVEWIVLWTSDLFWLPVHCLVSKKVSVKH